MLRRTSCSMLFLLIAASPPMASDEIKPGEWEATARITSASMAGAPPGIGKALGEGQRTTRRYCVMPGMATQQSLQDLLREHDGCQMSRFVAVRGRISAQMTCSQRGGRIDARLNGAYTATSFHASSRASVSGPMNFSLSGVTQGRWIGPCGGSAD